MGYTKSDVKCIRLKPECQQPTLLTDRSKSALTIHHYSEGWSSYTIYSLESHLPDSRAPGSRKEKGAPWTRDGRDSICTQSNHSYFLSRISENTYAFSMEISSSNSRHLRNGSFRCSGRCWTRCCCHIRRFRGRFSPTSRAYLSRFGCSQATRT